MKVVIHGLQSIRPKDSTDCTELAKVAFRQTKPMRHLRKFAFT